jgi:hypothetical protein
LKIFIPNHAIDGGHICSKSTCAAAAVLLSLGGRYYSGKNSFDISLTKDPNTAGAADFTLNFSFKRRF